MNIPKPHPDAALDIMRTADDEERVYTQEDDERFRHLLQTAVNATMPAGHYIVPALKLQDRKLLTPAQLHIFCLTTEYTNYETSDLAVAMSAAVIDRFPLRIFVKHQELEINRISGNAVTKPNGFSAHQQIEAIALARKTFSSESPLCKHFIGAQTP